MQNTDKRIVFTIPFLQSYLIIGTTDVPVEEDFEYESVSQEEKEYLRAIVNRYFKINMSIDHIIQDFWELDPYLMKMKKIHLL